jgi:hypothetical protein
LKKKIEKMSNSIQENKPLTEKLSELIGPIQKSPNWPRRSSGSRKIGVSGMASTGNFGFGLGASKIRLRKWSAPLLGSFKLR